MAERPHVSEYLPPGRWSRHDPLEQLPAGDELIAELTVAIDARFERGERHTHPTRGGCAVCAAEAADTAVRYLERHTRVIKSDALAPEEHTRARSAMKAMPYLSGGNHLRLTGDLGVHPTFPTVEDLLIDIESLRDRLVALAENDNGRDRELRVYRKWRDTIADIAAKAVDEFECLNPATIEDAE